MGLHKSICVGIMKALTGNSQVCILTLRRCTFLYFLSIEFWSFLGFFNFKYFQKSHYLIFSLYSQPLLCHSASFKDYLFKILKVVTQIKTFLPIPLKNNKQPHADVLNRCTWTFTIFTGKHVCGRGFFNKVAGLQACSFIKKRLQQRCFAVKLLRTAFLKNTSGGCFWNTSKQTFRKPLSRHFTTSCLIIQEK